ncbi:LPXTG cell wall anchor domain-containing protein [Thalassiella azotivora]
MFRRITAILALALATVLGLASASHSYPAPPSDTGVVSDGTVAPGEAFTFSADGFRAGSTVRIEVLGTSYAQSTTANEDGEVAARISLTESGTYTIQASGVAPDGSARVVTASVRVVAGAGGGAGSGDELPRTGSSTATQVWAGLGLLGLGAGMVALTVARRRQGAGSVA